MQLFAYLFQVASFLQFPFCTRLLDSRVGSGRSACLLPNHQSANSAVSCGVKEPACLRLEIIVIGFWIDSNQASGRPGFRSWIFRPLLNVLMVTVPTILDVVELFVVAPTVILPGTTSLVARSHRRQRDRNAESLRGTLSDRKDQILHT